MSASMSFSADQHHVHALDRGDLIGTCASAVGGLELHDHHGGIVDRLRGLVGGKRAVVEVRKRAGVGALALRRQLRAPRTTARASAAERTCGAITPIAPASRRRRDVVRRVGRNPHQRHDPEIERGEADLPGGIEGQRRMLQVDVERVEARGFGDAGDFDRARQPHRHRRHHLAARELVLDRICSRYRWRPPEGTPAMRPALGLIRGQGVCLQTTSTPAGEVS